MDTIETPRTTSSRQTKSLVERTALYEAHGVRFAILTADRQVLRRLQNALPCECTRVKVGSPAGLVSFSVRPERHTTGWVLRRNRNVVLRTDMFTELLHTLRGNLVEHVGRNSTGRTFVHAGAVAWRGRAIVLPGNSFAGKSTLVAHLLKLGATYYSDEVALLDANGLLHAYPRPLQLRPGCGLPRASYRRTAEDAHLWPGQPPIPIAIVVFSTYSADSPWTLKPLAPGMTVAHGLRFTFSARVSPARAMRAWASAARGAMAWVWKRGDAAVAARLLIRAMESGEVPTEPSQ
jgi:hypothetical protein